jgi:adenosylcobinamide-GDP ribazoletransferase
MRLRLLLFVRHWLLALQFFTRIPVTGRLAAWVGYSPAMLRASAAHMPSIGALIGVLAAVLFGLLLWALPSVPAAPWVAALASTVWTVWLTGAFHEDGLADLADGLGGSYDRERALEIMKDSRIGSFGSVALVLAFGLKAALLATLAQVDGALAVAALFGAHVSSRLAPLFVIATLPHVGDTPCSKSKPLADAISVSALVTGTLWWALAMALLLSWRAEPAWGAALLGTAVAALWMRRLLQRRLQGFTGDGLGATQQVGEIAFYLGLVLALGAGGST